ncbi:MAG: hypothetical protein MJ078_00705, partial [Clostridia bacterium]|nr:hypothetical protein [Clostridia bacterium]
DVEEGYVFYGWCDENGLKQTEISTETLGDVKLYARIGEEDKTAECISGSAVGGWFKDEANGNKKVLTVAIGGILDLTSVELSDVSEYGIYIYHSGDDQGIGEEAAFSKMDTELLDEGGLNYFYAYVRVEEANRDKTYYGVAYVIVNGEYYFSEMQSASVGANPVEVDPEKGIKGEED